MLERTHSEGEIGRWIPCLDGKGVMLGAELLIRNDFVKFVCKYPKNNFETFFRYVVVITITCITAVFDSGSCNWKVSLIN